ncbi:MAG TPA: ATP-binding protein [Candidatus Dormibacteraeota bacterium]|nr:ATP-binding protein [Candidatus Dormibacteraeota bacterium]
MTAPSFHDAGTVTDQIDVEITYQIIGLFSEGLYSSPNKAIEELVSNSFDADATSVDVAVSKDLASADATIAVFDNGAGMDAGGLKIHWIVGDSIKRRNRVTRAGRYTIGKFGIGKLASYVLGQRLTHISLTKGGQYVSTTMDFSQIPSTVSLPGEAQTAKGRRRQHVQLPLRTLTKAEARDALRPWLNSKGGLGSMKLFGVGASPSWTVAIISDLKPMAQEISVPRLRWVLSTAMPLRDDFHLYLDGTLVESSKLAAPKVGTWLIGRQLKEIPKPAAPDLIAGTDKKFGVSNYRHWHVTDKVLGPITGYLEVFEDPIDEGKSADVIGRSNGFFVYVNERLINPDDPGFGIDRNVLRHGTFSRFRVVAHINRLDDELRSSRESLRDGPRLLRSRQLLQGIFNFARTRLDEHEATTAGGRKASQRLADSPASLSERPILRLILESFESGRPSRHITIDNASQFRDVAALQTHVEERIKAGSGLVTDVVFADLGGLRPIAVLDAVTGILSINLEHPFVAHFADEFNDTRKNLPLQLFAVSEIVLEAQLRATGTSADEIESVLSERDELLRHLARDRGRRSSLTVAQDLLNAASDKKALESAVVAAFDQLGFEAIPKGAKNDPDGIAEAFLPPAGGQPGNYRVSLEAKSKEAPGAKVKKAGVEVSTIARHRDENNCNHAIVIGPGFETGKGDLGAVVAEIDADRKHNAKDGKTITLMNLHDLARLVRAAPIKRLSLAQLRGLFIARTPAQAATWVDQTLSSEPPKAPYADILETIWSEQQSDNKYSVEYGALRTALRLSRQVIISDEDLKNDCIALARMAPNLFFAHPDRVELNIKPSRVLRAIRDYVEQVPEAKK